MGVKIGEKTIVTKIKNNRMKLEVKIGGAILG